MQKIIIYTHDRVALFSFVSIEFSDIGGHERKCSPTKLTSTSMAYSKQIKSTQNLVIIQGVFDSLPTFTDDILSLLRPLT